MNSSVQDITPAQGENPQYMHTWNNGSVSKTIWDLLFLQRSITHPTPLMTKFPFCLMEPFNMTTVGIQHVYKPQYKLTIIRYAWPVTKRACISETEYRPLLPNSASTGHILLSSINPIDSRKWRRKSWSWRVFKVIKVGVCLWDKSHSIKTTKLKSLRYFLSINVVAFVSCTHQVPTEVLLLLCIPVVDPDKEDKNWRRPLNCLHLITAPLVCLLTFQSGQCKYITFLIKKKKKEKQKVVSQTTQKVSCFFLLYNVQMQSIWSRGSFPSGFWFFCWDSSYLRLSSAPQPTTVLPDITQ